MISLEYIIIIFTIIINNAVTDITTTTKYTIYFITTTFMNIYLLPIPIGGSKNTQSCYQEGKHSEMVEPGT